MKSKNPSSFFINYEKIQRPSVAGTVGGGLCTNADRISSFPGATWLGT